MEAGHLPSEFWEMTPKDAYDVIQGHYRREYEDYRRIAMLGKIIKGSKQKLDDLMPPWSERNMTAGERIERDRQAARDRLEAAKRRAAFMTKDK